MITTTNFSDVIARWGTMYGGFFGLAVVVAVILLILDILGPVLVWLDARRRGRSAVGWIVALIALPVLVMLPAVFFLLYSPIIGTVALSLPLAVLAAYLFASSATVTAVKVCPACGRTMPVTAQICPNCGSAVAALPGAMRAAVAGGGPQAQLGAPQQAVQAAPAPAQSVPRAAHEPEPGTRFAGHAPMGLFGLLVVTSGVDRGKEFRIEGDSIEIGRDAGTQIRLSDSEASRRHAKVKMEGGVARLYDLASTNGTFVNGEKITERELRDNDLIRIGTTDMMVKLLAPVAASAGPTPSGTMIKPAAKSATVFKQPPGWGGRIEAGPDAGKTFSLAVPMVVGRDEDCTLTLSDQTASRKHARVMVQDGVVFAEDLQSSNGTEIVRPDGVAVKVRPGKPQPIAEGERVRVGDTELSFTPPGDA